MDAVKQFNSEVCKPCIFLNDATHVFESAVGCMKVTSHKNNVYHFSCLHSPRPLLYQLATFFVLHFTQLLLINSSFTWPICFPAPLFPPKLTYLTQSNKIINDLLQLLIQENYSNFLSTVVLVVEEETVEVILHE